MTDKWDEFRQIRRWASRVAQEYFAPLAAEIDAQARYPIEALEQIRKHGFFGSLFPQEYGGAGVSALNTVAVIESFTEVCCNSALVVATQGLGSMPIVLAGTPEQKARYLPPLARGEQLAAFGLTEPGAGSDAGSIRTRAVRSDGHWVVNGGKCFISEGDIANVISLFTTIDPEKRHRGITAFILEKGTPGFRPGRIEEKMGCRGSHATELLFEDCRLDETTMLGEPGGGFALAMETLDHGRPVAAALALGTASGALADATAHAIQRVQFGRPIGEFQGVQFLLADMAAAVESSRLLTYEAARRLDDGDEDVTYWGAIAKLYASDAAMKVTTDAVQIFGGYGYVRPTPVERRMRDAKFFQIGEGTNEIQRIVIARRLLKR